MRGTSVIRWGGDVYAQADPVADEVRRVQKKEGYKGIRDELDFFAPQFSPQEREQNRVNVERANEVGGVVLYLLGHDMNEDEKKELFNTVFSRVATAGGKDEVEEMASSYLRVAGYLLGNDPALMKRFGTRPGGTVKAFDSGKGQEWKQGHGTTMLSEGNIRSEMVRLGLVPAPVEEEKRPDAWGRVKGNLVNAGLDWVSPHFTNGLFGKLKAAEDELAGLELERGNSGDTPQFKKKERVLKNRIAESRFQLASVFFEMGAMKRVDVPGAEEWWEHLVDLGGKAAEKGAGVAAGKKASKSPYMGLYKLVMDNATGNISVMTEATLYGVPSEGVEGFGAAKNLGRQYVDDFKGPKLPGMVEDKLKSEAKRKVDGTVSERIRDKVDVQVSASVMSANYAAMISDKAAFCLDALGDDKSGDLERIIGERVKSSGLTAVIWGKDLFDACFGDWDETYEVAHMFGVNKPLADIVSRNGYIEMDLGKAFVNGVFDVRIPRGRAVLEATYFNGGRHSMADLLKSQKRVGKGWNFLAKEELPQEKQVEVMSRPYLMLGIHVDLADYENFMLSSRERREGVELSELSEKFFAGWNSPKGLAAKRLGTVLSGAAAAGMGIAPKEAFKHEMRIVNDEDDVDFERVVDFGDQSRRMVSILTRPQKATQGINSVVEAFSESCFSVFNTPLDGMGSERRGEFQRARRDLNVAAQHAGFGTFEEAMASDESRTRFVAFVAKDLELYLVKGWSPHLGDKVSAERKRVMGRVFMWWKVVYPVIRSFEGERFGVDIDEGVMDVYRTLFEDDRFEKEYYKWENNTSTGVIEDRVKMRGYDIPE